MADKIHNVDINISSNVTPCSPIEFLQTFFFKNALPTSWKVEALAKQADFSTVKMWAMLFWNVSWR
jgi:hypothetical protein